MSVKVMTQVWERTDLGQSETLVLLALADHADDNGECWPSMQRIAEKARVQRRAVQRIVQKLEEKGLVTVERSVGRSNTNRFILHVEHLVEHKGVTETPLEKTCLSGQENVSLQAGKRVVATTPESSITIIEPSKLNRAAWRAWVQYRKERKFRPYTASGAVRQMEWLSRFTPEDQSAIVEQSTRQGYQGLFELKDANSKPSSNTRLSAVERVYAATQRQIDAACGDIAGGTGMAVDG